MQKTPLCQDGLPGLCGGGLVRNYYVRGQFFERTDNMVFFPDQGRKDAESAPPQAEPACMR